MTRITVATIKYVVALMIVYAVNFILFGKEDLKLNAVATLSYMFLFTKFYEQD